MANRNPNKKGLKPFNTLSKEEQLNIQRAGGLASSAKRKRLYLEIQMINEIRDKSDNDPFFVGICKLMERLKSDYCPTKDKLAILNYFRNIRNEYDNAVDSLRNRAYYTGESFEEDDLNERPIVIIKNTDTKKEEK